MNLSEMTIHGFAEALSSPMATPAGGALAFVTLASCSALFAKIARSNGENLSRFTRFSSLFMEFAKRDSESYRKISSSTVKSEAGALLREELSRAEAVLDFVETATTTPKPLNTKLAPDREAALALSLVCANTILENLDSNVWAFAGNETEALSLITRINFLKSRLAEYKDRFEYNGAGHG